VRLFWSLLRILFAVAGSTGLGWALTLRLRKGLFRGESLAWSFAAGLLAVTGIEGAFLALRLAPDPSRIWPAAAILAGLSIAKLRDPNAGRQKPPALSMIEKLAWAACLLPVAVYAVEALSEPMWPYDFLSNWGLKAKTIFLSSSIPARLFHDPEAFWSHPQYPLLLPLIFASLSSLNGLWDDQGLALIYPFSQTAILLALFGFFRRRGRPRAASAAILLAAFFVELFKSDLVGLAEVPLALGFLLLGQAFLDADKDESAQAVGRLCLASIFCSGLKKEGAVFALILGLFLAVRIARRRTAARWTASAALVIPPLAQSLLLRIARGAMPERDFAFPRAFLSFLPALADRARTVAEFALGSYVRDNLIALAAIAAFFLFTRKGRGEILLPPLLLQLSIYAGSILFTTWSDPTRHFQYSFPRLAGTLFPFFLLVLIGRRAASGTFLLRNQAPSPTME
jgi:hypothetical protein